MQNKIKVHKAPLYYLNLIKVQKLTKKPVNNTLYLFITGQMKNRVNIEIKKNR
jgi:hypothetical protein